MIRNATLEDLPDIRQILSHSNDYPYDVSAVAQEKCFGRGIDGEPETFIEPGKGLAVRCGRYMRLICVAREHRRRGLGSELLRHATAEVIAAEPGNYFTPGILETEAPFFEKHGYAPKAETWNLHADLSGGQAILPVRTDMIVSPPQENLLGFIEREFGRMWRFETERAAVSFYIENTAFAVVEANNRGLGTFGPTGVIPAMRGCGLGRELLRAALAELRRLGYSRGIIPWTGAIEFYRRACGAEPAHRFVTYTSRP